MTDLPRNQLFLCLQTLSIPDPKFGNPLVLFSHQNYKIDYKK